MVRTAEIIRVLEIRGLTFLSSILEEGEKAIDKEWGPKEIFGWFENQVNELWTSEEPSGNPAYRHLRTSVCNMKAHCLFSQSHGCIGFQNLFLLTSKSKYLKKARDIADYIVSHQEKNGLFLFHWKSYYPHDEGIATFLAVVALLRLFNITNEAKYLEASVKAGDTGCRHLYSDKLGYIHTIGQRFWTTNVNALVAYGYKLLFEVTQDEKYRGYIYNALTHTVNYQKEDGMFMYCGKRRGIYFTFYQSYVTFLLSFFKNSEWDERFMIAKRIDKAIDYLEGLRRKDGSMIEPDKERWVCMLSSVVTTAAYLKTKGIFLSENLRFLTQFITRKGLFIFKRDGNVFLKHRRGFQEYYTVEVFNWLTVIMLKQRGNLDRSRLEKSSGSLSGENLD